MSITAVEESEEEEDEPVCDDVQEISLNPMKTRQSPTAIVLSRAEKVIRIRELARWLVDYGKRTIAMTTNIALLYAVLPTLYKMDALWGMLLGMFGNEVHGTCIGR